MKKYLKFLACVLALGVMTSIPALRAQDAQTPPADGGKKGGKGGGRAMLTPAQRVEGLDKAVGPLSADQKAKLTAIMEKSAKDMQAIPQEERREKGRDMMMATNKEIRGVLTPDQQKKFDDMPRGGPGGPGGGKKKGGGEKN